MGSLTIWITRGVLMGIVALALLVLPALLKTPDATVHASSRQHSGYQKKKVYPAYHQRQYQSQRYSPNKSIKTNHYGKRSYPYQGTAYHKGRGKQSQPKYSYQSQKKYSYPISHTKKYQTAQYGKGYYPKRSGAKYAKAYSGKKYYPVQHTYQSQKRYSYPVHYGKQYAKYPSKSYRPTQYVKRSYPSYSGYQYQSQSQKQYSYGHGGKQYQYQTQYAYSPSYHGKKYDRRDYDKRDYPVHYASTYYPKYPVKDFFSVPKAKAFDGKYYDKDYKRYDYDYRFADYDFDRRFDDKRIRVIDGHDGYNFWNDGELFHCQKLDHNLFLCHKLS